MGSNPSKKAATTTNTNGTGTKPKDSSTKKDDTKPKAVTSPRKDAGIPDSSPRGGGDSSTKQDGKDKCALLSSSFSHCYAAQTIAELSSFVAACLSRRLFVLPVFHLHFRERVTFSFLGFISCVEMVGLVSLPLELFAFARAEEAPKIRAADLLLGYEIFQYPPFLSFRDAFVASWLCPLVSRSVCISSF